MTAVPRALSARLPGHGKVVSAVDHLAGDETPAPVGLIQPNVAQPDLSTTRAKPKAKPGPKPRGATQAAYERRQSQAAIAKHFAQVEADRAATAVSTTALAPETKSRFSSRTWEEAELVNPMRLQASEPPIPEHLRAELLRDMPGGYGGRVFGLYDNDEGGDA